MKSIKKEMKGVEGNFIVLTILPKEDYHEENLNLLKFLIGTKSKKDQGAYVSINKTYYDLVKMMDKSKINHNSLFFIDCTNEEGSKTDNCVFLKSAESLTNIGIALQPIYKSKEHKFIFFDSVDALSLYHDPNMIVRFMRDIIKRARKEKMSGLIIGVEGAVDKKIIDEISVVCDKTINFSILK